MAGGSRFTWFLLLSCVFQGSDSRHLPVPGNILDGPEENPDLVQSVPVQTCPGYRTNLEDKMKFFLDNLDTDTSLILKNSALTMEVNMLKKKVEIAANSTDTSKDIKLLQLKRLQEKMVELNAVRQQIGKNYAYPSQILQIIKVQNLIWQLEHEDAQRGNSSLPPNQRITVLQGELDGLIRQFRETGDANSAVLELISVENKIAAMRRIITKAPEDNTANYKIQLKRLVDILDKKISELYYDKNNEVLTKEILKLQAEIYHLEELIVNAMNSANSFLEAARLNLEHEEKKLLNLRKELEGAAYGRAEIIMKIINIMKDLRELQEDEQSTSQGINTGKENAIFQAEIMELLTILQSTDGESNEYIKTVFHEKLAELHKTGNSKAALILTVFNLYNELQSLKELLLITVDPKKISELQREIEEIQKELNSKSADMKAAIPDGQIIKTILFLKDVLWDLSKMSDNETSTELETVGDMIDKIDDNENIKAVLKIIWLQNQIGQHQRKMSHLKTLESSQANFKLLSELINDLATEERALQKYVNALNKDNNANARLLITVAALHNKVRNQMKQECPQISRKIIHIEAQLQERIAEHSRDQAQIKSLQFQMEKTEEKCSTAEQNLKSVQTELDSKMNDLLSKSKNITSLVLQVSTLTQQLAALQTQAKNTQSEIKIEVLEKIILEKQIYLNNMTEELKARSFQSATFLKIITIQADIEKLMSADANETNFLQLLGFNNFMQRLTRRIEEENGEKPRVVCQIMASHVEMAILNKQLESKIQAQNDHIQHLKNELEKTRIETDDKTRRVGTISETSDLRDQIKALKEKTESLQGEMSDLKKESNEDLKELQKKLDLSKKQLQVSQRHLEEADAHNSAIYRDIIELKAKLRTAQKMVSQKPAHSCKELGKKSKKKQQEKMTLQRENQDLKKLLIEKENSFTDHVIQCKDIENKLKRSQAEVDTLRQKMQENDARSEQLERHLEEHTKEKAKLQEAYDDIEKQLQQCQEDADTLRKNNDARFEQLERDLEEQTKEKAKLQEAYNDIEKQLQQCQEDADTQRKNNDTRSKQLERDLEEQTKEKAKLQEAYDDIEKQLQQSQEDADTQRKRNDARFEQLERDLEEQTRKKVKLQEAYDTALHDRTKLTDQVQDLQNELSAVKDRKIYTRRTVIDPDTANPRIALSAGNTEMSISAQRQNVLDSPGRFDVALAALGKHGFSSGRNYWEVSVPGHKCYQIGMVSESSQRNGAITFSPETGFWTIILNKQGQHKALNTIPEVISTDWQPQRIGIMLDYKVGQISFYDVGTKAHMYTFAGKAFNERMYPFVNLCVEDTENAAPVTFNPPGPVDWII